MFLPLRGRVTLLIKENRFLRPFVEVEVKLKEYKEFNCENLWLVPHE